LANPRDYDLPPLILGEAWPHGRPIAVDTAPCEHCGADEVHVSNCVVAVAERTDDPYPPAPSYTHPLAEQAIGVLTCERSARRGMEALWTRLEWDCVPSEIIAAHTAAERQLTRWFMENGLALLGALAERERRLRHG
jgi:hypothetical protein